MTRQTLDPASIAEESLHDSEESFTAYFEHAPFGVYRSSIYRFLAGNPMLARMFGYQNALEMVASVEIPGELFADIAEERAIVDMAMTSGRVVRRHVKLLRKDGSIFTADFRMKAVRNENGRLKFLAAFVEDLTKPGRAGHGHPQ